MELKFSIETAKEKLFPQMPSIDEVRSFIEEKIFGHKLVISTIQNALKFSFEKYQKEIYETEKRASVYLDPEEKYQIKTVESIIEKLWRDKTGNGNRYTVDNFHETMEDIIRFRILCNYLCDTEAMKQILPGKMRDWGYESVGEPKDFINKEPEERKKGHRAIHFIFRLEYNNQAYLFEVQVMTLLQNAWDRKDHSIVYESERIGEEVPLKTKMRSYAMSEMLFVADDYFNEILLKKRGAE